MGGIIHVLLEREKLQEPFNEVDVAVVEGSCGDGCTSVVGDYLAGLLVEESVSADP